MQFYRCKCGKVTSWTSMGVSACTRCKNCGSNLAQDPTAHSEPVSHEFVVRYDRITGAAHEECNRCLDTREEIEKQPEPEPEPMPLPDPYLSLVEQFPHCDQYVLHPAGTCEFCDLAKNKPLHEFRVMNGINHTGERHPGKKMCPAEERRSARTINNWQGNKAKK